MVRTDARRSAAQLKRDSAIRRVGLTRRVVIGAAGALTAGIAAFVSAVAPGRTLGAQTRNSAAYERAYKRYLAARARATAVRPERMPPLASPAQLGLAADSAPSEQQAAPAESAPAAPPVQAAPVAVPPPPPVAVSGGS
jgi:hypothetical protein